MSHYISITEAERATLQKLAADLGCLRASGAPSISQLLAEIAAGSIRVKRSRPARAISQAERRAMEAERYGQTAGSRLRKVAAQP